jgi:DNA gyrase subunit A
MPQPYKKSARVVGDVIGKYHPHGDQAVYDSITRMVQEFSLRYPLVDGQGNFGSIDGDAPAAMRYTEIRLTRMAEEMLKDLEKETVSFRPNYDESLSEPVVLPSKIPSLLINGSSGIAVGMATNIPPHNLNEAADALIAFIENPAITLEELMKHLPGPDFPTYGIIYGRQGIRQAYETGRGHITLRARSGIETHRKDGREAIVITELPYQVNKARLIENIVALINERRIEGIANIKDESSREGMRVVIELKRGELAMPILNKLYKHTQLQTTFGIIFLSIVGNEPKVLDLKTFLKELVEFRKEVITKRSTFELEKARERLHILEGLTKALDHIDEVIALIKASKNTPEARTNLMETFQFSERQATSILEMRLQRLTSLERTKILDDFNATLEEIKRLTRILESDQVLLDLIKEELRDLKQRYGDARRTEIVDELPDISIEDMIKEEEVVVTITYKGYIKRTPLDQYRQQLRGGKGKIGIVVREEDFVDHLYTASTHSNIMFFTSFGKALTIRVHAIPEATLTAKGKPAINLVSIDKDERITAVSYVTEFSDDKHLVLVTKMGTVKRISLGSLKNIRSSGLRVISLPEHDRLIAVLESDGQSEIMVATKRGMSIRFREQDVRDMGRTAYGVRGIRLRKADEVVSAQVVEAKSVIFTVTEKGYGKRSPLKEYRLQDRGGTGIINVRCGAQNGEVVGQKRVNDEDQIILATDTGRTIRFTAKSIPLHKRGGLGVRLMDLSPNEKISGVAITTESGEPAQNENGQPEPETEGL